jgi:hypothetical protein
MEVNIHANQIGAQTIIDTIENGDVILGSTNLGLDGRDRLHVLERLLAKLEEHLESLPAATLDAAERQQLLDAARQVAKEAANDKNESSRKSRVESFLKTLKGCFGSTAEVITTAINLAKVLSGAPG